MYFCSICLKTYKKMEEAMMCCAIDFTKEESEAHYRAIEKESKLTGKNRFNIK